MMQMEQDQTDTLVAEGGSLGWEHDLRGKLALPLWQRPRGSAGYAQPGANHLDPEVDGIYETALRTVSVKVSRARVVWHLLRLFYYAASFGAAVLWHRLTTKHRVERQRLNALSFRESLVRSGGVMIKVGQQLSQRADILPPAYCDALRKLLDDIESKIYKADVEAAIKRQTGRQLHEIFAHFDFDTVGSASIACVYRAILHTGNEVAVKVRRPGILKQFGADLTAMDWVLKFVEFLTIWRPGMSQNLMTELRDQLVEELDFRIEARYQEIFRRYLKRQKKLNVTAPKVYYQLSGEEVLVTEFVTGYWVKDIIAAMQRGDEEYIARLRSVDIDPKIVAKRLVRSQHYSFHECPLFHGDPHAANIVVQPNNRIVMVDFGACGVFTQRERNLVWHMNYYYSRQDVGGMVNMVISIMEPLPPNVDIEPFRRELVDAWWQGFYGIKSKHAAWWERTSFRLWLAFFKLMRKHQIPVPRNVLRMVRATLLYDTVAANLYSKINVFREFEKYSQGAARRARRLIEESAIRQILLGPDDSTFLKIRRFANVGNDLLYRVQKFLDNPEFSLADAAGKIYSAIRDFVRMSLIGSVMTLSSTLLAVIVHKGHWDVISHLRARAWHPSQLEWPLRTIVVGWLI